MVQTNWEVSAWKEQLESKGLMSPEWKVAKTFPHATRVVRSFVHLGPALNLYNTLRSVKGLGGVTKNWIGD